MSDYKQLWGAFQRKRYNQREMLKKSLPNPYFQCLILKQPSHMECSKINKDCVTILLKGPTSH